jgi:hypothetical protein
MNEFDMDPTDGEDSFGVNDVLDHLGKGVESIVDFIVPDGLLEWDLDPLPAPPAQGEGGAFESIRSMVSGETPPELINDGFYQSLPGVDSGVGLALDQTYQMISDIDDLGVETFGEQGWAQAEIESADEVAALEQSMPSAADLEYEFTVADSQGQRDFWEWQEEEGAKREIAEAEAARQKAEGVLFDPHYPETTPPTYPYRSPF